MDDLKVLAKKAGHRWFSQELMKAYGECKEEFDSWKHMGTHYLQNRTGDGIECDQSEYGASLQFFPVSKGRRKQSAGPALVACQYSDTLG